MLIGVEFDAEQNNVALSSDGEKICKCYIKALFSYWYPKLPIEGIE